MCVNAFCISWFLTITYSIYAFTADLTESQNFSKPIKVSLIRINQKNKKLVIYKKMHYMVIFYESWSLAMIRQRPYLHAGHFRPPVRHKVETLYNYSAIQTEYSNPSASEEFWFDFKKEWIFLLCPLSFILLLCVSLIPIPL